ncbi:unnamed protein product [Pylaiella littoralis]
MLLRKAVVVGSSACVYPPASPPPAHPVQHWANRRNTPIFFMSTIFHDLLPKLLSQISTNILVVRLTRPNNERLRDVFRIQANVLQSAGVRKNNVTANACFFPGHKWVVANKTYLCCQLNVSLFMGTMH